MKIFIIFLLLVGCSFSQQWEGPESHQLTRHVPTRSRVQQMRPLWSPSSSSVHQDLWPSAERNGQDHRNTLEHQLSLTGPMVFPHGHEGMFYIPPAPHHLPRPVHGLHHNVQRIPTHSPQVTERVDEGLEPVIHEWTRNSNAHSFSSSSHQSLPGWPHSTRWTIHDLAQQNPITTQIQFSQDVVS